MIPTPIPLGTGMPIMTDLRCSTAATWWLLVITVGVMMMLTGIAVVVDVIGVVMSMMRSRYDLIHV